MIFSLNLSSKLEGFGGKYVYQAKSITMFQIEHHFDKRPRLTDQPLTNRRKNELCKRFQRGYCGQGDRCCYAHVNVDLRKQQQLIAIDNKNRNPRYNGNFRLCFRFMNGEKCVYGDRCQFNHKRPLKTKLCYNWMSTGTCRYGFTCCYAHGELELQKEGIVVARDYEEDGTYEKKVDGKQWEFKWKDVEKISRVYADWINDTSLVHVETCNIAI